MQLPKTLQRYADKIDEIEDDRRNDNGWWVYLKRGWQDTYNPTCHQIHEDTLKVCASMVRDAIPCDCADCQAPYKDRAGVWHNLELELTKP